MLCGIVGKRAFMGPRFAFRLSPGRRVREIPTPQLVKIVISPTRNQIYSEVE
jgi:hypothetical protein